MNTPQKDKELTKKSIDKAVFVRAMAEVMMNLTSDQIKIPKEYRNQVLSVKELLKSDTSGLVNSLLDFAISCALVNYSVETNNRSLTELFNDWLNSINDDLRGQIPTGINALAKEYFRERWKGSSFIILRSIWENKNGFIVPTKLWFVNGEDIVIDDKSQDTFVIGKEKYLLQINRKEQKQIPVGRSEKIFVQKPYESWGTSYPIPFIIRRGIFKNLKLLDILATKGEYIIGKALEYLLLLKKGSENLALANQSEFIYSSEDLKTIKTQLEDLITDRKNIAGTPTYATNFDTEIEHLIPEYEKALKQELYTPMERRLLAGLGLIDVLQGIASTRRESTLNPRPFIAEVSSGIEDFKMILSDILETIIELNKDSHPKYIGQIRKVHSTPIAQFITDDMRDQFKDMYDRGVISKQTYVEVVGDLDLVVEVDRRSLETEDINKIMYPPVIKNEEVAPNAPLDNDEVPKPDGEDDISDEEQAIVEVGKYDSIDDLPDNVKNVLPRSAQSIWLETFNKTYPKGEDYARKVAWTVVKKLYKKVGDKWLPRKKVKSSFGSVELSSENVDSLLIDVAKLQDIELKLAQLKLTKKLLAEEEKQ